MLHKNRAIYQSLGPYTFLKLTKPVKYSTKRVLSWNTSQAASVGDENDQNTQLCFVIVQVLSVLRGARFGFDSVPILSMISKAQVLTARFGIA